MKNLFLFALFFVVKNIYAQEIPDSLMIKYYGELNQSEKGKILRKYVNFEFRGTEEEKLKLLFNTKAQFAKKGDEIGEDYCNVLLSTFAWRMGDYNRTIKEGLAILPRFEKRKDTFGMLFTLNSIAIASSDSKNNEQAIQYLNKSLSYAQAVKDKGGIITVLNNIADNYLKINQLDSALIYIQNASTAAEAYQKKNSQKELLLVLVYSTMSDIYIARNEFETAKPIVRSAINYSFIDSDTASISYNYSNLSACQYHSAHYDSALIYAKEAYNFAEPLYKPEMLRALEWMYKSYDKLNVKDSMHKYFLLAMNIKDSLYSLDKTKSIHQMNIAEQLREQEKINAEKQRAYERSKNIQYIGIFVFILTFIIFVFLLRKKNPNLKMIEYLGMLAVLLLYEFTSLLFHPLIERISNHNTVVMLICLVVLGALIAPLHHKLTVYVKEKVAVKK